MLFQSGDNEVSHNMIHKTSSRGIGVQGKSYVYFKDRVLYGVKATQENSLDFIHTRNNRIVFNDVFDCFRGVSDMGVFYSAQAGRGNVLNNNKLHSCNPLIGHKSAKGIYLDDDSFYYTVTNNIIYDITSDTGIGAPIVAKGSHHLIRNNIVADCGRQTPSLTKHPGFVWFMKLGKHLPNKDITVTNNIFFQNNGENLYYFFDWIDDEDDRLYSDSNLYWNKGGDYKVYTPDKKYCFDDWKKLFGGKCDRKSIIADPVFVDRENRDYRVKPGSPALEIGFKQIQTGSIGLNKDFKYRSDIEHQ